MPEKSTCKRAAQPPSGDGWRAADRPSRRASGPRGGFVEEIVDLARGFGIDSGHMLQIGDGRTLDCLERAEVPQQCTLAGGPDARDFLQAGFADVLLALLAVRPDRKAMRFVAQPLDEVEHRIAWAQPERLAPRHE